MIPSPAPLLALVGDAPHTRILIHALTQRFGPFPVIMEDPEPSSTFWARRKRQLGPLTTLSLRASALPIRLTKPFSAQRLREILARPNVSLDPIPEARLTRVPSVNSEAARDALRTLSPRAVFVCSTRMIGAKTLGSVPAPFINYHSGINPAYRGLYGGYHARARRDAANFGTTLHLVDKGVDTGTVLARHTVPVSKVDNFHTYVPLMAVESRQIVCEVMARALEGDLSTAPEPVPPLPSQQWYGPGVFSYLATGLIRGVW